MAVFAATPRSTRIFLSLAAASEVSSAATTSAVTHRGKCTGARRDAEAPTPSTRRRRRDKETPQVLRGLVQGRALLLRQALLFEGGRPAAHVLRVVRRQGGLLPVRFVLLRPRV